MILIQNKQKKGTDMRPSRGEFFDRKGIGPDKRNFDIPKELVKMLSKNVIKGRA